MFLSRREKDRYFFFYSQALAKCLTSRYVALHMSYSMCFHISSQNIVSSVQPPSVSLCLLQKIDQNLRKKDCTRWEQTHIGKLRRHNTSSPVPPFACPKSQGGCSSARQPHWNVDYFKFNGTVVSLICFYRVKSPTPGSINAFERGVVIWHTSRHSRGALKSVRHLVVSMA